MSNLEVAGKVGWFRRVLHDRLNATVFPVTLFSVSLDAIEGHGRLTVAGTAGCTGT